MMILVLKVAVGWAVVASTLFVAALAMPRFVPLRAVKAVVWLPILAIGIICGAVLRPLVAVGRSLERHP